jgi:hypothetical protein
VPATGAGRETPLSTVNLAPWLSSTSITRQRCVYIAPRMASLDVSHLRIEWRQRPERSATSSREPDQNAGGMELRTSYANQHHGENLYASVFTDNVNSVHQAAVAD